MQSWAVASHMQYDSHETMMILPIPTACPRTEKGHERVPAFSTRTRLGLQVAGSRMP